MSKVWCKGRVRAKDVAKFEQWARDLHAKVRTDPGTLAFGLYPLGVNDEYVFMECYKDSASALGHLANTMPLLVLMGDVAESAGQLEVYGDISDELKKAYDSFGGAIYRPFDEV